MTSSWQNCYHSDRRKYDSQHSEILINKSLSGSALYTSLSYDIWFTYNQTCAHNNCATIAILMGLTLTLILIIYHKLRVTRCGDIWTSMQYVINTSDIKLENAWLNKGYRCKPNAFSSLKNWDFRLRFHLTLFLKAQLAIRRYWFR